VSIFSLRISLYCFKTQKIAEDCRVKLLGWNVSPPSWKRYFDTYIDIDDDGGVKSDK
jgi:hypothetical protein